ncbi:MAG: AAA family ATPase [Thermoanaerobaculia bacterium]|nr:AAA family ATPase [Thermoanaerobaculia bacterium]
MARFFNVAGACNPADHYMLPPETRLPGIRTLIDEKSYFVIHAPRQTGKTTAFHALAAALTAEGRFAAALSSCKVASTAGDDVERGVRAVIQAIDHDARQQLPEDLAPGVASEVDGIGAEMRLKRYLAAWCERCPRPVVLFLDEIDALTGQSLLSVLSQLHAAYVSRPAGFPQALALIGLRDVRRCERELGTSSPFNVTTVSLLLRHFTAVEVAELYSQHTGATGQLFTPESVSLIFELTQGQPWLVNALADRIVRGEAPDPATVIRTEHGLAAKEALIVRDDTHLDWLIGRLREPRVRRVVAPILAGELPREAVPDDDLQFVKDLGLVRRGPTGLMIANPIYKEVAPRALASVIEGYLPVDLHS